VSCASYLCTVSPRKARRVPVRSNRASAGSVKAYWMKTPGRRLGSVIAKETATVHPASTTTIVVHDPRRWRVTPRAAQTNATMPAQMQTATAANRLSWRSANSSTGPATMDPTSATNPTVNMKTQRQAAGEPQRQDVDVPDVPAADRLLLLRPLSAHVGATLHTSRSAVQLRALSRPVPHMSSGSGVPAGRTSRA